MKKVIFGAIAMVLSASIFAQAKNDSTPTEPVAVTPQQVLDWSDPFGPSDWANGYSSGIIRATAKTIEILSRYNLTPLKICFPTGMTNGTLSSAIRDSMRSTTIPMYGGNSDNFDEDAIIQVALATLAKFPCR